METKKRTYIAGWYTTGILCGYILYSRVTKKEGNAIHMTPAELEALDYFEGVIISGFIPT